MGIYTITEWCLFFYIYSFIGWIWESAYVSILQKRFVNRGFLKGPFLPIYGSGALCVLIAVLPVREDPVKTFLVGMIAATVLEYVTGAVMERLFKVRYWDYTGKLLNVHGYICLASALCWGAMSLILTRWVHFYVAELVRRIPQPYGAWAVLVITPVFTADFVTSFTAAFHLGKFLEKTGRIQEELKKLLDKKALLEDSIQEAGEKAREQIVQELRELYMKIGQQKERMYRIYTKSVRGLLKRNPTAYSSRYKETFGELKKNILENWKKIMEDRF
ncbi:MAG TPA: putative ABC transporter permease [Candidatus Choladousia intestinigallinarum]|nr:putative ABC transporter permease [Candidatus Choladousia intestinigallinarum]